MYEMVCKFRFHQSRLTGSVYWSPCSTERLHGSHSLFYGGIGFTAFHRHKGSRLESRTTAQKRSTGTAPHGPFMVLGLAGDAELRDEAELRTVRDPSISGVLQKTSKQMPYDCGACVCQEQSWILQFWTRALSRLAAVPRNSAKLK